MELKKIVVYVCAFVFMSGIFACSGAKVTRISPETEVDLSGNWNDTDSRQVSEEMISDSLNRPWLSDYTAQFSKKPRIIVGTVVNKTDEHINPETFVKDLEVALTNSGKVVMVASSRQRDEIRAERDDQAVNARPDTAKAQGKEIGADFMLKGQINSIPDQNKGTKLKYYQVELELINVETNEKVWIGQKQIKKTISSKTYKP